MMERLLYLRLSVEQGLATVWLNGIPVLRNVPPGGAVALPVHEFLQTGTNQLRLQGDDTQATCARAQLMLVRVGKPIEAADGRLLGDLALAGQQAGTAAPAGASQETSVDLPVNFPRWRWLDLIPSALANDTRGKLHRWLAELAADLSRGQFAGLLQQSRLRVEELAQAYQTDPRAAMARLSAHLGTLHAEGALAWPAPFDETIQFVPVAGGRLLECLDAEGQPALRSAPDRHGVVHTLPLRVAIFEDQIHVLR